MPTDIINFLMLTDEERGSKAEQLLGDLREQAQALARRTGAEPMTFLEFTTLHKYDLSTRSTSNVFPGMLIGGTILGGIGLLMRSQQAAYSWAGMGALLGGALGAFWNTQNDSRYKAISGYSEYLGEFARQHQPHSRPSATISTREHHHAVETIPKTTTP